VLINTQAAGQKEEEGANRATTLCPALLACRFPLQPAALFPPSCPPARRNLFLFVQGCGDGDGDGDRRPTAATTVRGGDAHGSRSVVLRVISSARTHARRRSRGGGGGGVSSFRSGFVCSPLAISRAEKGHACSSFFFFFFFFIISYFNSALLFFLPLLFDEVCMLAILPLLLDELCMLAIVKMGDLGYLSVGSNSVVATASKKKRRRIL
jgi:hypothetical protein